MLIEKVKKIINEDLTLNRLLKILASLLIVYLITLTSGLWSSISAYFFKIMKPFIIGFFLAYVLHPVIKALQKKNISKNVSVPLIILVLLALIIWLGFSVFPLFYEEMGQFLSSINDSVQTIYKWYAAHVENPSQLINSVIKEFSGFLAEIQSDIFGNLTNFLSTVISSSLSLISTVTFSICVSIYILLDYDNFINAMMRLSDRISTNFSEYIIAIDSVLSVYIRSTLILMVIRFFEYAFFYYLVGHKGFLIMGLLYSVGVLIPYFGGIAANIIGILTFLTMPRTNMIALIIGIVILSTADGYLISPMVHSKTSNVEPLWSLLSIFIGSALLGPLGIMIAVPAYMAIREIRNVYRDRKGLSYIEEDY